jgi:hypothetical protein
MHDLINVYPSLIAIGIIGILGLAGLAAAGRGRRLQPVPVRARRNRR